MVDQPVPVAVAVGGALNMAGFVGQDALGGGQVHRVFVDDGVVGPASQCSATSSGE